MHDLCKELSEPLDPVRMRDILEGESPLEPVLMRKVLEGESPLQPVRMIVV